MTSRNFSAWGLCPRAATRGARLDLSRPVPPRTGGGGGWGCVWGHRHGGAAKPPRWRVGGRGAAPAVGLGAASGSLQLGVGVGPGFWKADSFWLLRQINGPFVLMER